MGSFAGLPASAVLNVPLAPGRCTSWLILHPVVSRISVASLRRSQPVPSLGSCCIHARPALTLCRSNLPRASADPWQDVAFGLVFFILVASEPSRSWGSIKGLPAGPCTGLSAAAGGDLVPGFAIYCFRVDSGASRFRPCLRSFWSCQPFAGASARRVLDTTRRATTISDYPDKVGQVNNSDGIAQMTATPQFQRRRRDPTHSAPTPKRGTELHGAASPCSSPCQCRLNGKGTDVKIKKEGSG